MAATIEEHPFPLDFAGNKVAFRLRGTPRSSAGRKSVSSFQVTTMPTPGYSLFVNYGSETLSLTVTVAYNKRDDPNFLLRKTTTAATRQELTKKIADNYDIAQLYDVTVSDTLAIVFTSKDVGGEAVQISTNDPNAVITETQQTTGLPQVLRTNYRIFGRIEIEKYVDGAVTSLTTPEFLLQPDSEDRAKLTLELLRPYFTQCDIPATGETLAAYVLRYIFLKYRLIYSDCFGTPARVQCLQTSDQYILAAGTLQEESKKLNLPDWASPTDANAQLSHCPHIRNYGSPTDLTLKSFADMPQYAYFMLFDKASGTSLTRTLQVKASVMDGDGTTHSTTAVALTIHNFNIVRIPLSVSALGLSLLATNPVFYEVTCQETGSTAIWRRRFVLQQKPYFAKTFLLQNRYGVLESFFADNEMEEREVDGDEVVRDGGFEIAVTDRATVFTVRTGSKTADELRLVAEAMENGMNYRLLNGTPQPITILPDTLTISDEEDDLHNAEFQYRLNTPQNDAGEAVISLPVIGGGTLWQEIANGSDVRWNDEIPYALTEVDNTLIANL